MTYLDTLYKTTKTGAIQVCKLSYRDDTFFVSYGQLDGAMQEQFTKCYTTNEGRANERTPQEQAKFECIAKHAKKIKAGYSTDKTAPVTVALPMKVKVYQDQLKNVVFPCEVQPKLNGINATYTLVNSKLVLTSRGGEVYPPIPTLEDRVLAIMRHANTDRLAGELYIHNQHLQDISSYVKKTKPESADLEFHIFDVPNVPGTRQERMKALNSVVNFTDVAIISSVLANSHEELDILHTQAVSTGYEGIVIYNLNGAYQYNTRSSDVFKYKKTIDSEFLVTGYELDKHGHCVYICDAGEGLPFKVKRKGTAPERLADAAIADQNIGLWLNVEFETWSKPKPNYTRGLPQKPVGNNFRKCNHNGTPLE